MKAEALIKGFWIEGLYGYRTIAMTASTSTTILIAKNGAGKTTLLGALDALLRCQFSRLANIKFERIICKFHGVEKDIELYARDIESLRSTPETPEFFSLSRRYGVEPQELLDFIENDFDANRSIPSYEEDEEIFRRILTKHDYNYKEARKACERLADSLRGRVPSIDAIRDVVRSVMRGREVLYLPTYRRIELSLSDGLDDTRVRRRVSIKNKLGLPKRGFFNADIQFGLGDISERLRDLNNELLAVSNQGYRQFSAKIVNDLLDGTFEKSAAEPGDLPEREALIVFFSRIKQGGRRMFGSDIIDVPDVDKIYLEGAATPNSNKFLNYFLAQLNEVIKATQAIEGRVEEFVDHCNQYLSSRDTSTELIGDSTLVRSKHADDKQLQINRLSLKLRVVSVAGKKEVPIDSLSSGEKQMISLFARLYLYPGPKIVLIDEPELSLSIDWQRRILMDVVKAPNCEQLIAITHSPFVFDNELDPYAKSLFLTIDPSAEIEDEAGDLFSDEVSSDE